MSEPVNSKLLAIEAHRSGQKNSLELIESALADHPSDGALLIAHAAQSALDREIDPFARLERTLDRSPDWVDGHKALVRLKSEFGATEPFAAIEAALKRLPDHPRLWMAYLNLLASADRHLDAADHAADLCNRIGEIPGLRLLEARFAGLGGDADRAGLILAGVPEGTPQLSYERARNAMRLSRLDSAVASIALALAETPDDIISWALAELCWRAAEDPKHAWLIPDDSLISAVELGIDAERIERISEVVEAFHRTSAAPLGQSVKGGTQTRGDLRWRKEPEILELFKAIDSALESFAKSLPRFGRDHPLSSLNGRGLEITSSWSVKLIHGGHHVSHLHDGGLVSSALHLVVPSNLPRGEGRLELGRPPTDIELPIEPIASFAPRAGRLILFPSFLYHGTTPFEAGKRLTVAFDAA